MGVIKASVPELVYFIPVITTTTAWIKIRIQSQNMVTKGGFALSLAEHNKSSNHWVNWSEAPTCVFLMSIYISNVL